MQTILEYIVESISSQNPLHSKKIKRNLIEFDTEYFSRANIFFDKYNTLLQNQNRTIDYAIDCYLQMVADINYETVQFAKTGEYSSKSFDEVNARVYNNPLIMEYYMHGLIMSQFLWKHHYQIFDYFINTLPQFVSHTNSYLEIGAGHGLYLSKALEILNIETELSVVDISKSSIELAKKFTNDNRVKFILKDIFDFDNSTKFDFITMGEVLEHVEDPLKLLLKLNDLLTNNGTIFITAPTNAPTIDHIFLFHNIQQIQQLIKLAGFKIVSDKSFFAEDISPEKAEEYKIAILWGAFLKK